MKKMMNESASKHHWWICINVFKNFENRHWALEILTENERNSVREYIVYIENKPVD